MPITNVNGIVFVIQQSPSQFHKPASQFCIWRLSFKYYPRKSGAPNRIVLSDSQSANLWIYETNSRGCLNEGGMNQSADNFIKDIKHNIIFLPICFLSVYSHFTLLKIKARFTCNNHTSIDCRKGRMQYMYTQYCTYSYVLRRIFWCKMACLNV